MGADWYFIQGFYGYEICVPNDSSFKETVQLLADLSNIIDESFVIVAVLSEFYSRVDDMDVEELKEMYEHSSFIIGFRTINELNKMVENTNALKEYITDNPIFTGIEFVENPGFFCGLEVFGSLYDMFYDDDNNSDEDEDDNSDNTSDEDEEKVAPDTE
jgi:hypothetical protein